MALGFGFGFPRRWPGATVWTPARIQTALWLDAADSSTITLNGSTVSQWNDKSGNGRNAVQATASLQPAYQGPSLIYFDGTDDTMTYTLSGFTTQGTAIVAFNPDNDASYGLLLNSVDDYVRFTDGYTYPLIFRTARVQQAATVFAANNPQLYEITADSSAPDYKLYRNGTVAYSSSDSFTFGSVPNRVGGSIAFRGWMYEIIICNYVLSQADRQLLEGYLAWKWGLLSSLPSNHPYRWDGTVFGYGKLWNPAQTTTALWLDAYDPSTITLNGSNVSQWNDKSGNGRNVSQATAASQPTYSATGWESSKPAIVYNNKILENTTASFKLIARSLFVVVKETTRGSFTGIFTVKPASGSDFDQTTGFTATTGLIGTSNFEIAGSTGISYRPSVNINESTFGIYGEVKQAGVGNLFRNGTLQATDNSFVEFNADSAGGFRVGSRYNNTGIIGNVAEVIYLESTVSTAERQLIEGYLAWKWGGF